MIASLRRFRVLAFVSFAIGGTACSQGNVDMPARPGADYGARLADAVCSNLGECCKAAGFAYQPAQCAALAAPAEQRAFDALLARGHVDYDPAAAAHCFEVTADLARTCAADFEPAQRACDAAFIGTLPLGAACEDPLECAPQPEGPVYCPSVTPVPGGIPGSHCQLASPPPPPAPHGKPGDFCGGTCRDDGGEFICAVRASVNGDLAGSVDCFTSDGLDCNCRDTACSKQQGCSKLPALGEACVDFCVTGAYCDGRLCQARTADGSCALGEFACVDSATCDSLTHMCKPRGASGDACLRDQNCQAGLICEKRVCRVKTVATEALCTGTAGPAP